jgi:FkbM family methyltransferase
MALAKLAQSARFWLGYGANCLKEWLLAEGRMPPVRWLPWGSSWCYDLRRCFAAAGKTSPRIIFDVGANIGHTARYMHMHFPRAQIHAFEPVEAAYQELLRNTKKTPQIHCYQLALGEKKDTLKMALHAYPTMNTMRQNNFSDKNITGFCEVPVTTIDAFVAEHNIPHIGFLKLDVEGYEMPVLQGAEQSLRDRKILAIHSEVIFRNKRSTFEWTEFEQTNQHLSSFGFDLVSFYDFWRVGTYREYLLLCDALWVNWDALYSRAKDAESSC